MNRLKNKDLLFPILGSVMLLITLANWVKMNHVMSNDKFEQSSELSLPKSTEGNLPGKES